MSAARLARLLLVVDDVLIGQEGHLRVDPLLVAENDSGDSQCDAAYERWEVLWEKVGDRSRRVRVGHAPCMVECKSTGNLSLMVRHIALHEKCNLSIIVFFVSLEWLASTLYYL